MSKSQNKILSDLIGISQLTIDALTEVREVVESKIPLLVLDKEKNRKQQQKIKRITNVVGYKLNSKINESKLFSTQEFSINREAAVSRLNGLLGDHLVSENNALAIKMSLRKNGVTWDEQELIDAIVKAKGRVVIMVHGLTLGDIHWSRKEHDHGMSLYEDLGMLPLYLNYNSGLHISENGQNFSALLESLVDSSPIPLSMHIIGHSMGGLVSRSACHYGKEGSNKWVQSLQKMVFLGTPHNGSLLEKSGSWLSTLLEKNDLGKTISNLGKIRSRAVTDMRFGYLLEEDWKEQDRFDFASNNNKTPVPLPEKVECYAIAATTNKKSALVADQIVGDGLVTINSAFGRHHEEKWHLNFPESNQWIGRNMSHMDLLNHPDVYDVLKNWLEDK